MISEDRFGNGRESRKTFLRSLPAFPLRETEGHKGTYGTSLLCGGSFGMSGAVILAGNAALAAGSGLVRLLIPESIWGIVASAKPEYMTVPLAADRKGRIALNGAERLDILFSNATAVGFGPGMGRSVGLDVLSVRLYHRLRMTTVLDADALNGLSAREIFLAPEARTVFDAVPTIIPQGARILTPHPGEFARMSGMKISADPERRRSAALNFVRSLRERYGESAPPTILVLKGAGTVVTDGISVFVNETGNPGMGTGGAGDVLTGIITAFCAQRIRPYDAAVLGVALHGLAGDLAAREKGEMSLTAEDLIRFLPNAFSLYHEAVGETEKSGD